MGSQTSCILLVHVQQRGNRNSCSSARCGVQARGALHALAWTPDGRRLLTGAASGSFSLWDGASFNFETMLQVCSALHCLTGRSESGD